MYVLPFHLFNRLFFIFPTFHWLCQKELAKHQNNCTQVFPISSARDNLNEKPDMPNGHGPSLEEAQKVDEVVQDIEQNGDVAEDDSSSALSEVKGSAFSNYSGSVFVHIFVKITKSS